MSETVAIRNARGECLAGSFDPPPEELARGVAAVLCHGMESSKSGLKHVRLAAELAARGVAALRFDFAGCGESEGDFTAMTYTREVEDLNAVASWLEARGVDRIALFGSSMGGAVAFLFAGSGQPCARRIAGVATLAAVGRPGQIPSPLLSRERFERWQRDGFLELSEGRRIGFGLMEDAGRIDVLAAASRVRSPVLVVHGSADEVVPVEQGRELFAAVPHDAKELLIVEGGDHRISAPADLDRVVTKLADWLPSVLSVR